MRTDPLSGVCYILKADQYVTLFVRNAVFPTLSSLRFDITFVGEENFFQNLLKGYLPYQSWSLTIMDSGLNELGRYSWRTSLVTRVAFPNIENSSSDLIVLSVELFLTGLTEGSQDGQAASANMQSASRRDPLPMFAFRFLGQGLEGVEWSVTKIAAFKIGPKINEDFVLNVTPEADANPFRDWLRDGNQPRSANVEFLSADLRLIFRMNLASLRVISVVPPLTTFAPTPATVRLSYGSVSFEFNDAAPTPRVPTKPKPSVLTNFAGPRRGF